MFRKYIQQYPSFLTDLIILAIGAIVVYFASGAVEHFRVHLRVSDAPRCFANGRTVFGLGILDGWICRFFLAAVVRGDPNTERSRGGDGRAECRQSQGGIRQSSQERIPGQHVARNSHADERHYRHDRADPRHRTIRRAAGEHRAGTDLGAIAVADPQRRARFLQNRSRQARALRPNFRCGMVVGDVVKSFGPRAHEKGLEIAGHVLDGCSGPIDRRSFAASPDSRQSGRKRDQIHVGSAKSLLLVESECDEGDRGAVPFFRSGHRNRHSGQRAADDIRGVYTGRRQCEAPVRRDWTWGWQFRLDW